MKAKTIIQEMETIAKNIEFIREQMKDEMQTYNYNANNIIMSPDYTVDQKTEILRMLEEQHQKNKAELMSDINELEKKAKELKSPAKEIDNLSRSSTSKEKNATQKVSWMRGATDILKQKWAEVKEAVVDACAKIGKLPSEIKANSKEFFDVVADKHKVRKSVDAINATLNFSKSATREEQCTLINQLKDNKDQAEKAAECAEKEWYKGISKSERAYAKEVVKSALKAFFNPKSHGLKDIPTREQFGISPDRDGVDKIKENLAEAGAYVKSSAEIENRLRESELNIIASEMKLGYVDRPEGMDEATYAKVSEALRDTVIRDYNNVVGGDDLKQYAEATKEINLVSEGEITGQAKIPVYDTDQLRQISTGLKHGIDVTRYADPDLSIHLSAKKMNVIRTCLEHDIPVPNIYKVKTMSLEDLYKNAINKATEVINKDEFIKNLVDREMPHMADEIVTSKEINKGIEDKLDSFEEYNKPEYQEELSQTIVDTAQDIVNLQKEDMEELKDAANREETSQEYFDQVTGKEAMDAEYEEYDKDDNDDFDAPDLDDDDAR